MIALLSIVVLVFHFQEPCGLFNPVGKFSNMVRVHFELIIVLKTREFMEQFRPLELHLATSSVSQVGCFAVSKVGWHCSKISHVVLGARNSTYISFITKVYFSDSSVEVT